ncbi:MAG: hypothetical protein ABDI19_00365, partial [Armatimonadota bacterium]
MWDELRQVFWLEYRRHLRSRPFWRLLLVVAGVSMGCAALFAFLMRLDDPSMGIGRWVVPFAMGLLTVLGGVAMVAPALVIPRIFSDMYKTRELYDIYLTALHPLSIVVGRMLTASVQAGLVLLTLFPAGMLICQLAGFSAGYWLSVLVLTWSALLVMIGLSVVGLGKRFPADTVGALTGAPAQAASWASWLWLISVAILFGYLLTGNRSHLPVYMIFPLLIPFEALARVSLGGWELPLWVVALPMMVGIVALAAVATAQWLGWWSDVAYCWQRWGGTLLFLLSYSLNLALYAQSAVRSMVDAERVLFWSMVGGALVYAFVFARMLGYYGMGIRFQPRRMSLPPPLGGLVWELALIISMALLAWLTVGFASGYWVAPVRWLAWSGCMLSLLWLAQAWQAWMLTFYYLWFRYPPERRHVNRGEVRAYVEAAGSRIASTLLTWLGALLAVSWLLTIVPEPLIQALGSGLIWINPL